MNESNLESVMGLIMYGGKPKVMLWRLFRQQKKVISLKPIED